MEQLADNPDLVELLASWLQEEETIRDFADGQIGAFGQLGGPNYVEIGHTMAMEDTETPKHRHLVSIHIWSRTSDPTELHELLSRAGEAIALRSSYLSPSVDFREVRYDEEQGAHHGLLRMKLSFPKDPIGAT